MLQALTNRERIISSLTLCKNRLYTKVSIQHCRALLFSPANIGIMPAVRALHPDDIAVFTSSIQQQERAREPPKSSSTLKSPRATSAKSAETSFAKHVAELELP